MEKDFKTIEEQIEILKTWGIIINDEKAKEILEENKNTIELKYKIILDNVYIILYNYSIVDNSVIHRSKEWNCI